MYAMNFYSITRVEYVIILMSPMTLIFCNMILKGYLALLEDDLGSLYLECPIVILLECTYVRLIGTPFSGTMN